jgi:hypothetical protein
MANRANVDRPRKEEAGGAFAERAAEYAARAIIRAGSTFGFNDARLIFEA